MTELVVVSGKGGTGKTSIVGSLAVLAQNKVMVDCDVDAADLHLILNNNIEKTVDFIGGKQATIVEDRCNNCGLCVDYCRFDAINLAPPTLSTNGDKYKIDPFACDGCGVCVRHCPEDALEFGDVVSGQWYLSTTAYGPLVHARLGLAQANSGKLVSILRQQARSLAIENQSELIIVDGPPGIGCPVIASTTGANYVLIVTEPSLSAIHDMERLRKLTRHFGIPTGICINKADINPELTARIEGFAKSNRVAIVGRIPFDPAVTQAQLAHTTVIERPLSRAAVEINKLWDSLETELAQTHDKPNPITIIQTDITNKEYRR